MSWGHPCTILFVVSEHSYCGNVTRRKFVGSILVARDWHWSIERFSAKENFVKILKVSHFYLGFSPDKNNKQIKHVQRVSLELS